MRSSSDRREWWRFCLGRPWRPVRYTFWQIGTVPGVLFYPERRDISAVLSQVRRLTHEFTCVIAAFR